jgi:hypothetical protein
MSQTGMFRTVAALALGAALAAPFAASAGEPVIEPKKK